MPKEALLYRVVDAEKKLVECLACPRRCNVVEGKCGFCGIR